MDAEFVVHKLDDNKCFVAKPMDDQKHVLLPPEEILPHLSSSEIKAEKLRKLKSYQSYTLVDGEILKKYKSLNKKLRNSAQFTGRMIDVSRKHSIPFISREDFHNFLTTEIEMSDTVPFSLLPETNSADQLVPISSKHARAVADGGKNPSPSKKSKTSSPSEQTSTMSPKADTAIPKQTAAKSPKNVNDSASASNVTSTKVKTSKTSKRSVGPAPSAMNVDAESVSASNDPQVPSTPIKRSRSKKSATTIDEPTNSVTATSGKRKSNEEPAEDSIIVPGPSAPTCKRSKKASTTTTEDSDVTPRARKSPQMSMPSPVSVPKPLAVPQSSNITDMDIDEIMPTPHELSPTRAHERDQASRRNRRKQKKDEVESVDGTSYSVSSQKADKSDDALAAPASSLVKRASRKLLANVDPCNIQELLSAITSSKTIPDIDELTRIETSLFEKVEKLMNIKKMHQQALDLTKEIGMQKKGSERT